MFSPNFEGRQTLDGLLALAGSPFDTGAVEKRFKEAIANREPKSEVIPTLFDGEPRFPDPAVAQKLYENLFGLWQLVSSGRPVPQERTPRAPKPTLPEPPGAFGEVPDGSWVAKAGAFLAALDEPARRSLADGFENRQDALLQWLDQTGLPDQAFATLRNVFFELWAMLEQGWPKGLKGIQPPALSSSGSEVPAALEAFVEEALSDADLEGDEGARRIARGGLNALWSARRA